MTQGSLLPAITGLLVLVEPIFYPLLAVGVIPVVQAGVGLCCGGRGLCTLQDREGQSGSVGLVCGFGSVVSGASWLPQLPLKAVMEQGSPGQWGR